MSLQIRQQAHPPKQFCFGGCACSECLGRVNRVSTDWKTGLGIYPEWPAVGSVRHSSSQVNGLR